MLWLGRCGKTILTRAIFCEGSRLQACEICRIALLHVFGFAGIPSTLVVIVFVPSLVVPCFVVATQIVSCVLVCSSWCVMCNGVALLPFFCGRGTYHFALIACLGDSWMLIPGIWRAILRDLRSTLGIWRPVLEIWTLTSGILGGLLGI